MRYSSYIYSSSADPRPGTVVYIVHKQAPATPTPCLVNLVFAQSQNSTPTSVLAESDGAFKINNRGAFIPVESPLCLPYTGNNTQNITVAPMNDERHAVTTTIWQYNNASSSSFISHHTSYYTTPEPLLTKGEIAGIVVSGVALGSILAGLLVWLLRRRKARQRVPVEFSSKTFDDDSTYEDSHQHSQIYAAVAPEPKELARDQSQRDSEKDRLSTDFTEVSLTTRRSSMTWVGSNGISSPSKRDSLSRFDETVSPM